MFSLFQNIGKMLYIAQFQGPYLQLVSEKKWEDNHLLYGIDEIDRSYILKFNLVSISEIKS